MMRAWKSLLPVVLFIGCASAQTITVGGGAPTPAITFIFEWTWQQNGFGLLVGNPITNVIKFGSTGLIQEFPGATDASQTLALVKPDMTETYNVQQVLAAMYAYYSSFAVETIGYPTTYTLNCPALQSVSGNSCQYQTFTGDYALFLYATALAGGGQNFSTSGPFYTLWSTLGGVSGLGPATSAQATVTSRYGSVASFQTYDQGAIYNITSGLYSGRLLSVQEPVYNVYAANGGAAGSLGLPETGALLLASGMYEQTFEGGAIEYNPATGIAALEPPIGSLAISPSGSIQMNLGATISAQATVVSTSGVVLTDRTVNWLTSNGQIIQIQASGLSATLKAVGAGVATVTVNASGVTSQPLTISVTAPCCQIGEGAPTAAIQAAFQNAVTRNDLSVQIPAASGVMRDGNGYVQQLVSGSTPPVTYLIAVADGSATGYVVAGPILTAYLALGGPTGALGYPVSDATAGGRQLFQQGALAGSPVQMVSGAILAEWASLGYETGIAGSPTSAVTTFQTFLGTSGNEQLFQSALILARSGSSSAFAVTGLILAQYNASGGPAGNLGAPTDNQHVVNGLNQQDFEGGYINYASGASAANVVTTPRQPVVIATPATVIAGSPVHLVAGGFNNGATVRVSQTGQPDFIATVASGAYAWDVWIPASAIPGVVTVTAADTQSIASAQSTYTIRAASSVVLAISAVSGDNQDGAPGALLSQPLVVLVTDSSGNPVAGQTVIFAASPGAQVTPSSAITGTNGQASTNLRLPDSAGIALVTAQTGGVLVTFGAQVAAFSLTNFSALSQAVSGTLGNGSDTIAQKGALLTSVASILQYYQSLTELPEPNGLANPASLNQFLKSFCVFDNEGNQICDGFVALAGSEEQTVNLWRVGAFVSGSITVSIEQVSLDTVRDLVSAGYPVLLALSLGGTGSHFVVATGIAADASILIADPDPAFAQTNLNAYLNGFSTGGATIQGTLTGVVRLLPQAQIPPAFLVTANAPPSISSVAGACGSSLQFPATAAVAGVTPPAAPGSLYFHPCDGSAGPYELDIAAQGAFNAIFTDLSENGGRSILSGSQGSSSLIAQNGSFWTLAPVTLSLTAAGVVNAANPSTGIAPGGLISIFGAGLANAAVEVSGQSAPILASLPFQINAQIPLSVAPGAAIVSVTSPAGSAQQSITISPVAPAIFSVTATQAAITNQDNSLNSSSNPALRGSTIVVYGTGFGAVSASGKLSVAAMPVTALIGGVPIAAAFAGLTPGAVGLYQANIPLPSTLPPGLNLPLLLTQAGVLSNTVNVAIQ